MHTIGREQLEKLLTDGAQLVEVLGPEDYEDEHLPGAINIPLEGLNADGVSTLDRDRPVVVYCYDYQ